MAAPIPIPDLNLNSTATATSGNAYLGDKTFGRPSPVTLKSNAPWIAILAVAGAVGAYLYVSRKGK